MDEEPDRGLGGPAITKNDKGGKELEKALDLSDSQPLQAAFVARVGEGEALFAVEEEAVHQLLNGKRGLFFKGKVDEGGSVRFGKFARKLHAQAEEGVVGGEMNLPVGKLPVQAVNKIAGDDGGSAHAAQKKK